MAKSPTPKHPAGNGPGRQRKPAGGEVRPVLYPVLTVNGIPIPPEALRITRATARRLLGWETEREFTARKLGENPKLKPDSPTATFGEDYLLTVGEGKERQKVRCWNNLYNRPLTMATAEAYSQDILNRAWAGCTTMSGTTVTLPLHKSIGGGSQEFPEATVNGEAIIIGRTEQVESGQHRLIGLELACQEWERNERWRENWPEEPYIESVVVFGVSEAPQVVRTLDNVRPRGLDDVFYTSELFRGHGPVQRKKLSRMLRNMVNLLWARLEVGKNDKAHEHQTHCESLTFVERHGGPKGKLLQALKTIHTLCGDATLDPFNAQKVWAGHAAGLLWLMGASASAEEDYHPLDPPTDRKLDWSRWPQAVEFWKAFKDRGSEVRAVCDALAALVSEGGGSRKEEKLCILARGWAALLANGEVAPSDVALSQEDDYAVNDRTGMPEFVGTVDFGGIDRGSGPPPPPPPDLEAAKAAARAQHAEELRTAVERTQTGTTTDTNHEEDGPPPIALHDHATPAGRPRPRRAQGEVEKPEPLGADGNPPTPKARPRPKAKVEAVVEEADGEDDQEEAE